MMKSAGKLDYVARHSLVNLLSEQDTERMRVSDTVAFVSRGDLYLDLEHLELGAQHATRSERVRVGRILPRNAVSDRTWDTVLLLVASRPGMAPLGL